MWLALFLGSLHIVLEPGFDPRTYGLWAHHASAALGPKIKTWL